MRLKKEHQLFRSRPLFSIQTKTFLKDFCHERWQFIERRRRLANRLANTHLKHVFVELFAGQQLDEQSAERPDVDLNVGFGYCLLLRTSRILFKHSGAMYWNVPTQFLV